MYLRNVREVNVIDIPIPLRCVRLIAEKWPTIAMKIIQQFCTFSDLNETRSHEADSWRKYYKISAHTTINFGLH